MNAPEAIFSTIEDVVSAVYDQESSNEDAISRIMEIVMADKRLLERSIAVIVRRAAEDMMSKKRHAERGAIARHVRPFNVTAVMDSTANIAAKTWLDARLSTHKRIADATLDDIEQERKRYEANAEGHAKMARFYGFIGEFMRKRKNKGAKVADCLDATDLDGLAQRAGVGS